MILLSFSSERSRGAMFVSTMPNVEAKPAPRLWSGLEKAGLLQ